MCAAIEVREGFMNALKATHFGVVRQLGLLTSDLDRFVASYRKLFGLEPDRLTTVPEGASAEQCKRRIAYYNFPEIELEVIEPVNSKRVWHEFLEKRGDCLHHIQHNVDDLAAACARMEQNGCVMIERGFSINVAEAEYVFYDTLAQVGYVTELVNFREIASQKAQRCADVRKE